MILHSTPPSSNRTCRFPASGSRGIFNEAVKGDLCIEQIHLYTGDEGRRHVATKISDRIGPTPVGAATKLIAFSLMELSVGNSAVCQLGGVNLKKF